MFRRWKRLLGENRPLFLFHLMLRAAVACLGLWKLSQGRWGHAGLCLLTLALFALPALAGTLLKLRVPALLELAACLFALCANVFGEMLGFYLRFPWWDMALHVIWGFLAGLLGCALLEALQGAELKPFAAALAALSFAALTGILWEFFEYGMDALFAVDMQKDAWLPSVHSVLLNPDGANAAVTVAPDTVAVDGSLWPGLLDPGLRDTVSDLFLNFLGSLAAFFALLLRPRPKLLRRLMPAPFPEKEEISNEIR